MEVSAAACRTSSEESSHISSLDSQVLQDMLQLLKETVSSRHAERLEQIVIALIGVEIGMLLPICVIAELALTSIQSSAS